MNLQGDGCDMRATQPGWTELSGSSGLSGTRAGGAGTKRGWRMTELSVETLPGLRYRTKKWPDVPEEGGGGGRNRTDE